MCDSAIVTEMAKAIPVLLGAILAVGGGIAGHFLVHRLNSERDAKKLRREKIESLVEALYEHGNWLDSKKDSMVFNNNTFDAPSPLNVVRMVQALHFPELEAAVDSVHTTQLPLIKFMGEQRVARLKDKEKWIENWDFTPYLDAYRKYLDEVEKLTVLCREYYDDKK